MKLKIIFLTVRMRPGFGVAVVIAEVSRRLRQRGVEVMVGCLEREGDFGELDVRHVPADPVALQALCRELGATHIIAHSTPYFESLPGVREASTWAWEHGDPDPAFFADSQIERAAQIQRKKSAVYPNIEGVLAISDFIRSQIAWPAAKLVRNGWEHVNTSAATDSPATLSFTAAPGQLRVGCLMRLGHGEDQYKGGALYRQLADLCPSLHFSLMGRGTEQDARAFATAGIQVFRNANDAERAEYLDAIDVFITPSLWEGCNLPLLEAQARGTAALAFDTGAHPEFGGLVFGSVPEMAALLSHWQAHPALLEKEAQRIQQWVRSTFSWDITTDALVEALLNS